MNRTGNFIEKMIANGQSISAKGNKMQEIYLDEEATTLFVPAAEGAIIFYFLQPDTGEP